MKIALIHDYLFTYGGAERVLEALHELYPQAPVYTAWVDWQWLKKNKPEWKKWQIIPSWFDKLPFKKQLCSPLRFLTALIWSSFDLSKFDLVISSSAWYMAKLVSLKKRKKQLHFCYCHTPPRYLYGYPTALNFKRYWWGRLYAKIINPFMRCYDFRSSQTIDHFICNSKEVAKRIKKFYRREAKVVYPPLFDFKTKKKNTAVKQSKNINIDNKNIDRKNKQGNAGYFLMVNRLVAPKHTALGIKACQQIKQQLKIVGSGPEEKKLKQLAANNPQIELLGYVDDQELARLYQNCKAVLYLAEAEDFGIIPVEAMFFGKPVIGLKSGGIKESIIANKTGIFINQPEINQLVKAMQSPQLNKIKPADCIQQANNFSQKKFKQQIKQFIAEKSKNNYY